MTTTTTEEINKFESAITTPELQQMLNDLEDNVRFIEAESAAGNCYYYNLEDVLKAVEVTDDDDDADYQPSPEHTRTVDGVVYITGEEFFRLLVEEGRSKLGNYLKHFIDIYGQQYSSGSGGSDNDNN
jgi:hypothetical protein